MKRILLLVTGLLSLTLTAQQSYYNDVNLTLTGIQLRDALATKVINTHSNSLSYSEIWTASMITDEDPNNANNVLLIYGWENGSDGDVTNDLSRDKMSNGGNVGDWNREHTFANSLANPSLDASSTNGPPYSDAHNLRPSDVQRNGQRGNRLFATGSGNSGTVGAYWYPGDATTGGTDWRGDVARIIMYMYIRYGNQCAPNLVAVGTQNSVDANMIDLLLEWNAADPVSAIEDARNTYHEDIFNATAQGNRNPFIDNPRLATQIWGGTPAEDRWGIYSTDTQAPTVPTNVMVSNETSSSIDVSWDASTDNVAVTEYDVYVDATFYQTVATTSITVTGLSASTTYNFTVAAKDAEGNTSAQSGIVNGTTLAGGGTGGGSDLYFSEYMEGSSLNKALEIANFTGSTIDLNDAGNVYTLKISTNGNAMWNSTYSFPMGAMIADGDVYVIANSSLAVCTGVVDDSNNTITGFNGNDAIGLFKNDVLIDILGTLGDGTTYAENTTLVRKPSVNAPNTTYTASEWDTFPSNTCDNLGMHTQTLSTTTFEAENFQVYPNPTNGGFIYINTKNNVEVSAVTIFDIAGRQVISQNNVSNQINVSGLQQGMYLLQLQIGNQTVTKKLIKQ
ncbi:putative secreted protein (Por secretion system target) [Kordia periserrulae]|uniref:Putative secreted protein (Por secretion system target) n=1 Tax=Kordia periserrulae TaxID=701523 RepID=A0A2T6C3E4_9FLAO|nr:endonuclease [Kordia periserrulae]PTX62846.1 putative secreted protein (Por secretion system target) [Kordia periserrulae]